MNKNWKLYIIFVLIVAASLTACVGPSKTDCARIEGKYVTDGIKTEISEHYGMLDSIRIWVAAKGGSTLGLDWEKLSFEEGQWFVYTESYFPHDDPVSRDVIYSLDDSDKKYVVYSKYGCVIPVKLP